MRQVGTFCVLPMPKRFAARWKKEKRDEAKDFGAYRDAFENLIDLFPFDRPFAVSTAARDNLKPLVSALIDGYLGATSLNTSKRPVTPRLQIKNESLKEVTILKELTWNYVILSCSCHSTARLQSCCRTSLWHFCDGDI
jgi:hypothetical protein